MDLHLRPNFRREGNNGAVFPSIVGGRRSYGPRAVVGEDGVSRGRCQGRKEVRWMLTVISAGRGGCESFRMAVSSYPPHIT